MERVDEERYERETGIKIGRVCEGRESGKVVNESWEG